MATPIWKKAGRQDVSFVDEKYLPSLNAFQDNFIEGGNQGMEVNTAAAQIIQRIFLKHPKARYIIARQRMVIRGRTTGNED